MGAHEWRCVLQPKWNSEQDSRRMMVFRPYDAEPICSGRTNKPVSQRVSQASLRATNQAMRVTYRMCGETHRWSDVGPTQFRGASASICFRAEPCGTFDWQGWRMMSMPEIHGCRKEDSDTLQCIGQQASILSAVCSHQYSEALPYITARELRTYLRTIHLSRVPKLRRIFFNRS